jgi:hypothetical protein
MPSVFETSLFVENGHLRFMAVERIRRAASARAYFAEPADRRLRIDYTTRPAHRFESVGVEESADEVMIEIHVTSPRGPTRAAGHEHTLFVDLSAPLGHRRVVDRRSGRALPRLPSPSDPPPRTGGPGT